MAPSDNYYGVDATRPSTLMSRPLHQNRLGLDDRRGLAGQLLKDRQAFTYRGPPVGLPTIPPVAKPWCADQRKLYRVTWPKLRDLAQHFD